MVMATTSIPRRSVRPPAVESLVLSFFFLVKCLVTVGIMLEVLLIDYMLNWLANVGVNNLAWCDRSRTLEVGSHCHAATLQEEVEQLLLHFLSAGDTRFESVDAVDL